MSGQDSARAKERELIKWGRAQDAKAAHDTRKANERKTK